MATSCSKAYLKCVDYLVLDFSSQYFLTETMVSRLTEKREVPDLFAECTHIHALFINRASPPSGGG